jgi:hypothetical protein
MLNTSSTVEPLQVIYGSRKVGGTRCLCEVSGPNNEYLNIVIALGEGTVSNLSMIYIDDVPITDPKFSGPDAHFFMASTAQGLTTYRPRLADGTESQATQLVYAEFHPGADGARASAALQAELPLKWTPDHLGGGVAYLYLKCTYDRAAFGSVPTITADIQGKLVGGVFAEETFFSNNPAHCLLDYLTNDRYGRGISGWQIDQASFDAAAAYCDETLTIEVPAVSFGWSGISLPAFTYPVPRYTCDGLINVNNTIFDNVNALLSSCRGMLIYSGGMYKLVLDRPTAVSMDFNETNITGNWTISKPSRRQQFNKVTAGIFNPENNWQPDYAISDDWDDRNNRDNGLMLESKIDLPFTASIVTGRRLAAMHRKQSRFNTSISFTALPEGMRAEVGDVISITHSTPGWTAKEFRVQQISLASSGEVEITATEYDVSVYDVDAQGQYPAPTGNNTPTIFALTPPTGLMVAMEDIAQPDGSLVTRITATWDASLDPFVTGYELQWREDAGAWHTASQVGTLFVLPNTVPGHLYVVQVRAINSIGTHSPWVTGQSVTFGVPVAIPAFPILNATSELFGISFTWSFGDARKDISYSELVWSQTNDRSTAVTLMQVAYPQTSYRQSSLAPGEGGYYWLRVMDKHGNASLFNPLSSTQGLHATASVDPGLLLNALLGSLSVDQLTANLRSKIDLIEAQGGLITSLQNTSSTSADLIDQVQVRLDSGDYAAVKQAAEVNTHATGVLNTRHTVTLDSNGYVSGTESVNTGSSASFTVLADKFLIAKPNGSGIPIPLLALGTVGGVTALGLSGNLIVDGSIVGRALDVNTITAEKINGTNLNVVNGTFSGTIAAGSVDFASSVGSNFNYTSAGNYTLIVPTGMTSMRVTIKGAGGGGAGGSTRSSGYGGGGAEGATATTLLTVTPGQTFTLRVGAGGAGGAGMDAPFSYQYAAAGQETYLNGVLAAGGGAAGVLSNAADHAAGDGWSYYGDKGGGTYGGLGAATYQQAGQAGILGDGGGGGAGTGAIYHTQPQPSPGGNGGAGFANIEYFDPNGLVLKSTLDALKAELRTQGLTIS